MPIFEWDTIFAHGREVAAIGPDGNFPTAGWTRNFQ